MSSQADATRTTPKAQKAVVAPGEAARDFADIVARYQSPLLRYVGRMLGQTHGQVEDVVQETFLRLHRQWVNHPDVAIDRVHSWLYRVAHNLTLDVIRKRGRTKLVNQKLKETAASESITDDTVGRMVQEEAATAAMSELDLLPSELKEVVQLKVIEGLSMRQIAKVTGISLGSVNYRLNQGLKTLAQRLKQKTVI